MPSVADLHRAVQATLASKRLGTPVFVRYLFQGAEAVLTRLTQTVSVIRGWVGRDLERLYALGSVKSGQITLTLEFEGGATALVGWSSTNSAGGGVDLTLLGNHGALYHDAGGDRLWQDPLDAPPAKPDRDLTAWIERALRSHRPEAVNDGGRP